VKVDFHFHLEEGPYSLNWLQRTMKAIDNVDQMTSNLKRRGHTNTLQWISDSEKALHHRLESGCFTEEWLEAYITIGQSRGIERFGIVDHLYRFTEFLPYYEEHMILDDSDLGRKQRYWYDRVCIGSIEPFLAVVRKIQAKGYPISIGVEADYFPGGEEKLASLLVNYELDYVIGSVHFLDGWGFDNPETKGLFEEKNLLELYGKLFDNLAAAARSGLFNIIAHLDNLKVFNYRPDEQELIPLYHQIAQVLQDTNMATEINTGLAYRYPVKEMCPSPAFLRILHDYDIPIMLSSDAHFPDDIGTMLDEAAALAKETGYEEIVYFKERQRVKITLD
jgi:histidinol-phosphatase (PHP family)